METILYVKPLTETDEIEVKTVAPGAHPHYEVFSRDRKDDFVAYLTNLGATVEEIDGYLAEAGW